MEESKVDGVCCEDFWQYLAENFDSFIDNVIENITEIGTFLYGTVQKIFS